MHTVQQDQAIHVFGIELRTSNDQAFDTIPPHWQRFANEQVLARIPGKLSDEVYAVYTNFQNAGRNNQGSYSLVIGAAVAPDTPLPAGLARAVVPASQRAVFTVAPGRFDLVGAKWQEIWQHTELPKTFIAEYERYSADGAIDILVGITAEHVAA
jgi:predicted transcriptional regulator YdeE